jgi:hypothetical protein
VVCSNRSPVSHPTGGCRPQGLSTRRKKDSTEARQPVSESDEPRRLTDRRRAPTGGPGILRSAHSYILSAGYRVGVGSCVFASRTDPFRTRRACPGSSRVVVGQFFRGRCVDRPVLTQQIQYHKSRAGQSVCHLGRRHRHRSPSQGRPVHVARSACTADGADDIPSVRCPRRRLIPRRRRYVSGQCDAHRHRHRRHLPVGAFDGTNIWVTNQGSNRVSKLLPG